ncbi:MAG: PD40 domain-containing protein [Deltaproteobacteria bacterium]|nr:PD40 domain-containing protein [Deltaproteobacteria bacterium]
MPAKKSQPIAIVAAERGPLGIRLVAIDEHGDRRFELVVPGTANEVVRDSHPAVSPDGRWVVFASTRGRKDGTSLWIAPLTGAPQATPRRITPDGAVDQHPMWSADGQAIVFASTRDGGDFDLWRVAIDAHGQPGGATQLTSGAGHEITPTFGPVNTIVYTAVTVVGTEGSVSSRLEERAADGAIRAITAGPADGSPAISPDGATLIFVRPAMHLDQPQAELWKIERGAWRSTGDDVVATRLLTLPITDESGPVWSRDGRFVFATSVLRGHAGKPLFSSIIHVDLRESTPRARMLVDRAGATVRLSPAIRSERLDVAALHADPEYLSELARIVAAAIAEQTSDQPAP